MPLKAALGLSPNETAEASTRKRSESGVRPLHYRVRTGEDIAIGDETWVSYDGEVALAARVVDKDDRHHFVEFECGHRRYPGVCNGPHFLYHDEVRTTPEEACVNMVTL